MREKSNRRTLGGSDLCVTRACNVRGMIENSLSLLLLLLLVTHAKSGERFWTWRAKNDANDLFFYGGKFKFLTKSRYIIVYITICIITNESLLSCDQFAELKNTITTGVDELKTQFEARCSLQWVRLGEQRRSAGRGVIFTSTKKSELKTTTTTTSITRTKTTKSKNSEQRRRRWQRSIRNNSFSQSDDDDAGARITAAAA